MFIGRDHGPKKLLVIIRGGSCLNALRLGWGDWSVPHGNYDGIGILSVRCGGSQFVQRLFMAS